MLPVTRTVHALAKSRLFDVPESRFVSTMGHFTFWISLSLSPKCELRPPKISQKVKSFSVWTQRFTERFAETKLRTERSLNPKLINSSVDFGCTRLWSICCRVGLFFTPYSLNCSEKGFIAAGLHVDTILRASAVCKLHLDGAFQYSFFHINWSYIMLKLYFFLFWLKSNQISRALVAHRLYLQLKTFSVKFKKILIYGLR